jgi:AcrR family transcriptional regulator
MLEGAELVLPGFDVRRLPLNSLAPPQADCGRRWRNQALRRAQVLAAAREMLSCVGHERLTLKDLAKDCGISVQTIYNLVGNKSLVIRDAITDLSQLIDEMARSAKGYPCYAIASTDAIWHLAQENPECHRQLSRAQMVVDIELAGVVRRHAIQRYRRAFIDERAQFRRNVAVAEVASAITSMVSMTMYEWSVGIIGSPELRKSLIVGVGLIMTGATVPAVSEKISAFVSRLA